MNKQWQASPTDWETGRQHNTSIIVFSCSRACWIRGAFFGSNSHQKAWEGFLLVVQFQRVRYGYLQLGVVVLGLAVQMDPDARHSEGVSGLGLVNVWDWNALGESAMEEERESDGER